MENSLINPPNHLLVFELNSDKHEIPSDLQLEIHMDRNGLRYLVEQLSLFLDFKANQHIHFMTPGWGGNELSEEVQGEGDILINHVKLMFWTD